MSVPRLHLAISPCPNDTFLFGPLALGWIALPFEPVFRFEDIENLNRLALVGTVPVIKLSFALLAEVFPRYRVFPVGAALGRGCGPILVARRPLAREEVPGVRVLLPGEHTTAHLLFRLAFPEARKKEFCLYSRIIPRLLSGEAEAGVLIHEERFSFRERGLYPVLDLGEWWEKETGLPLPLGGIFVREDLPREWGQALLSALRKAFFQARSRFEELLPFIRRYAQDLSREVIEAHLRTYVNVYTLDLGEEGRRAIYELARRTGISPGPELFWG